MPGFEPINAAPSKEFFIDMLTQDITLTECVLDLIDNAVHHAVQSAGADIKKALLGRSTVTLAKYSIAINLTSRSFEIHDTCGGISVNDAKTDVFRLGRLTPKTKILGLGVYGIGMKRAFFKLGRHICVESRTETERFEVTIDVDRWKKREDWSFQFDTIERRRTSKHNAGTTIRITRLLDPARRHFGVATFLTDLRGKIATTYALFLQQGLKIIVNGTAIAPDIPAFKRSKELGTMRSQFQSGAVDILIMGGVTSPSDRVPRGWYVFCNGRMVLEADKTHVTGWRNGVQWNPKYNHFLGWALFFSPDVGALPWRTTKEGVNYESPVYQRALAEMRTLTKPILRFMAERYPGEVSESIPAREVLARAREVSIVKIAREQNRTFSARIPARKDARDVRVQFDRPRSEVREIAESVDQPRMSAAKVGEFTFDYYLKNMVR